MFRGVKWEEALKDAKRYEEERAKEGDAVRIRPYKNGGGFWDNLDTFAPIKETYVPLPKDYSPILMKEGGDVPHNMIKHSSPLAMNQHGLFQHDLYNAVQQTGFGIKSYVKYV